MGKHMDELIMGLVLLTLFEGASMVATKPPDPHQLVCRYCTTPNSWRISACRAEGGWKPPDGVGQGCRARVPLVCKSLYLWTLAGVLPQVSEERSDGESLIYLMA